MLNIFFFQGDPWKIAGFLQFIISIFSSAFACKATCKLKLNNGQCGTNWVNGLVNFISTTNIYFNIQYSLQVRGWESLA